MRKTSLLTCLAFLMVAAPLTASAEPLKFSERPLTYHEGTLAVTGGLLIQDLILDTGFAVHGTVAYGITDDFEVGALAAPIQLSPDGKYGDPILHARYRFLKSVLELGAEVQAILPVKDNSNLNLRVGLSGLLGLTDTMGLWFGAHIGIEFADPDAILSLIVPVQFRMNFTDNVFLFADSGLNFNDFDFDKSSIPLGAGVGYTLPGPTGDAQLDIFAGVNMPAFINLGPGDTIITDFWTITLGATFFVM